MPATTQADCIDWATHFQKQNFINSVSSILILSHDLWRDSPMHASPSQCHKFILWCTFALYTHCSPNWATSTVKCNQSSYKCRWMELIGVGGVKSLELPLRNNYTRYFLQFQLKFLFSVQFSVKSMYYNLNSSQYFSIFNCFLDIFWLLG